MLYALRGRGTMPNHRLLTGSSLNKPALSKLERTEALLAEPLQQVTEVKLRYGLRDPRLLSSRIPQRERHDPTV
jgi:hypothetical protein